MKIWKDLKVLRKRRNWLRKSGQEELERGLPEEALKEFQVDWEEDIGIDTRPERRWSICTGHKMQEGEKIPLLINIHGGGFVKGRRDQDIVYCRNIGSRFGGAVADIDYVPAPCYAVSGARSMPVMMSCNTFGNHGEEMGIDVKRIAMGGHSAGGTLTAASILMAIDQSGFLPALQILDYAGH